jgi:hypothetical protein
VQLAVGGVVAARGEELYQVKTAYFCCGITTVPFSRVGPIVNEAAPIMAWSKGKTLNAVIKWVGSKGGSVKRVGI